MDIGFNQSTSFAVRPTLMFIQLNSGLQWEHRLTMVKIRTTKATTIAAIGLFCSLEHGFRGDVGLVPGHAAVDLVYLAVHIPRSRKGGMFTEWETHLMGFPGENHTFRACNLPHHGILPRYTSGLKLFGSLGPGPYPEHPNG